MYVKKRIISLALVIICLLSVIPPVSAAVYVDLNTTAWEKIPNHNSLSIRTYALQPSGRLYSFTNASLTNRGSGWIDQQTDECWIQKIADNGKALYIKYPIGGGRYTSRWFSSQEFLGVDLGGYLPTLIATGRMNVYSRYNGGKYYGYVAAGDKIYVLHTHSAYTGVVYPLDAGGYKVGYVRNQDLQNNTRVNSDMVDVTASLAGRQVYLKSGQNGKYLCARTDLSDAPAMFCATKPQGWETFKVTVTADGWAGFQAHNGKWLSARSNESNAPVKANAGQLSAWECFKIYKRGSDYFLKSQSTGKWVTANVDLRDTPAQCFTGNAYGWERILIELPGSERLTPAYTNPMKDFHTRYTQWGKYASYRTDNRRYHVGVDYMSDTDSTVYAFADGKVAAAGWNKANGNFVLIEHSIPDSNGAHKTVYSFYGHLDSYRVAVDQMVTAGDQIGVVGATGTSSNGIVHLHFSVFTRKWTSGAAYGYATYFTGDKVTYSNVTYYNPYYIINNGKLP